MMKTSQKFGEFPHSFLSGGEANVNSIFNVYSDMSGAAEG